MSPVEPCMLVRPEPCSSQMSQMVAQRLGGVEPPRGLVDAHGVEVRDVRELLGQVGVAADDAAAVAHDADDAAVLPVADLLLVGALEQPQELAARSPSLSAAISLISVTKLGQGPFSSSSNIGVLLGESAIVVSLFGLE